MKNICCEPKCGANICNSCGACLTEHNEDPAMNCPNNPIHRTTANCEQIKELEAENKLLKETIANIKKY